MKRKSDLYISPTALPPHQSDLTPSGTTRAFNEEWEAISPAVAKVLAENGLDIGGHGDARFIADDEMMGDDIVDDILDRALEYMPMDRRSPEARTQMAKSIQRLRTMAKRVPKYHELPIHIRISMLDQPVKKKEVDITGIPGSQLIKWKSIKKPAAFDAKGGAVPAETQRAIEAELAFRWRQILIAKLRPHMGSFPTMLTAIADSENQEIALHDLFGTARFGTLAAHGRRLGKILAIYSGIIPWNTNKLLTFFEKMEKLNKDKEKPFTSDTALSYWKTIKYLSDILGVTDKLDMKLIKNKRDAVRSRFITTVEKQDRRATAPGIGVAKALEKASEDGETYMDRGWSAVGRHAMGASGRFNDYQHASSTTYKDGPKTTDMEAWQTKVTDLLTKTRPMPLIAPKISFTGIEWWVTLTEFLKTIQKLMGHRDYIMPAPTADRKGFRKEPLKSGTALTWYRRVLVQGGLTATEAKKQTMSGWRVFMPELAYQAGISRDRRRYLGRWLNEDMADHYTREHRTVILDIWKEVLNKDSKDELPLPKEGDHTVPINLTDDYYGLAKTDLKMVKATLTPRKDSDSDCEEERLAQTMDIVETWVVPAAAEKADTTTPRSFTRRPTERRTPFNEVEPEKGGPLTIIGNNKASKSPKEAAPTKKAHLIRTDKTSICGYSYNIKRVAIYSMQDEWLQDRHMYKACWGCWNLYTVPDDWDQEPPSAEPNDDLSLEEPLGDTSDAESPDSEAGATTSSGATASDADDGACIPEDAKKPPKQ
jgi:hypothetical protein